VSWRKKNLQMCVIKRFSCSVANLLTAAYRFCILLVLYSKKNS